jgi:uncharacterized protein with von Willebrand factor type A (vWA) domain
MEGQEKRPRTQDEAEKEDEEPDTAHLVVLVDQSGSMDPQRHTMIPAVERMLRHTAQEMPAAQRDQKNVQVYFFASTIEKVLSLTFAGILDAPRGLGLHYEPNGNTALYNSLVAVLPHCARGATLFIATDGENTVDEPETQASAQRALTLAKEERNIKVLALTEGREALAQIRMMEVEVMQSAQGADGALSQALDDPAVLAQLSQSLMPDL